MPDDETRIITRIHAALDMGQSQRSVADALEISSAHISRAVCERHITPTLLWAARRAGWVDYEPRRRFAADIDDATRATVEELRHLTGWDNGTLLREALTALRAAWYEAL